MQDGCSGIFSLSMQFILQVYKPLAVLSAVVYIISTLPHYSFRDVQVHWFPEFESVWYVKNAISHHIPL